MGLPFKRRARCAGEPKPPIADTGATQDIASYRSIKNQCDLIDFLRITHHGSLKNVKSTAGAAPAPALKHAYVLPHSRSHGHLPWINALSTTNSSSPRPSPESARRRRSSGSPLPHLVLKPTPGAHPHQHHTSTKTEPIRHHPPVTGGESVGPPPCPLSVRRWPHRARSPTIPQQRRIASQSHPLSGERAGRSSVAVLTRRWGRAALESTSAAMHTSLARCSHAAHGRTRAGPWPRLGHVARDPVAGRGWTADRPSRVGLLPRGSFSGLPKDLKYAPTYCLGRYAFPRVLVLGMVRGHLQKPLS